MRRRFLLALALGTLPVLSALAPADANHACVAASVTAPILGTRNPSRCLPSPFTRPFHYHECDALPPAGLELCLTVDAHTP
jgi:hypothetical protein